MSSGCSLVLFKCQDIFSLKNHLENAKFSLFASYTPFFQLLFSPPIEAQTLSLKTKQKQTSKQTKNSPKTQTKEKYEHGSQRFAVAGFLEEHVSLFSSFFPHSKDIPHTQM